MIEIVLSVVLAELSYRFIEDTDPSWYHWGIFEYFKKGRPKSRQEKKRQVQVARRSLKVMAGTFVADRVTDTLHGICAEEKCIGYITKT